MRSEVVDDNQNVFSVSHVGEVTTDLIPRTVGECNFYGFTSVSRLSREKGSFPFLLRFGPCWGTLLFLGVVVCSWSCLGDQGELGLLLSFEDFSAGISYGTLE